MALTIPNPLPNEELLLVVRRHWLVFARKVVLLAILLLLPFVPLLLVPTLSEHIVERTATGALVVMGLSAFYLFLGLLLFHSWLDFYLDVWMVTTKRIANIEQRGIFSRVVSELHIDRVQDVTVEVHGVLATMMHFGDVHIQTAAETARFFFDDIPRPYDVAAKIMELHQKVAGTPEAPPNPGLATPPTPPQQPGTPTVPPQTNR